MTRAKKPVRRQYAYRQELPFVESTRKGFAWWSVRPSGDYSRDYATGKEYALKFWKVCGKHGNMGLDLSSILIGLCKAKRTRRRQGTRRSISGIEIGFLRTIGDLFQASMYATVMVGVGPGRLAKRDLSKREAAAKCNVAAKLVGILTAGIIPGAGPKVIH